MMMIFNDNKFSSKYKMCLGERGQRGETGEPGEKGNQGNN